LLLAGLALLSGLAPADALLAILTDIAMVVAAFLSADTPARWHSGERARWGWFALSSIAYLTVWAVFYTHGFKGECPTSPR
jgi:bacteriorhodopsin